jgi:DNA-3-methyladenine glycosylase II
MDATNLNLAIKHLSRRDKVLRRIIRQVGPCTLKPKRDRFAILVRSIVSQQISTKAADSIAKRLIALLEPEGLKPHRILETPEAELRACGLSNNKTRFLLDLSRKVHEGDVPLRSLHRLQDDEVVERLIPVKGIGRWTAEMFLIFSLGRMDVLPVDDLGLRAAIRNEFGFRELPTRQEIMDLADPWRPYRTIATWYFWRSLSVGAAPSKK